MLTAWMGLTSPNFWCSWLWKPLIVWSSLTHASTSSVPLFYGGKKPAHSLARTRSVWSLPPLQPEKGIPLQPDKGKPPWAQQRMSKPGNHSICEGRDFNSIGEPDENEVVAANALHFMTEPLELPGNPAAAISLKHPPKCITRPSTQLTGGSIIDHVLYHSLCTRGSSISP